MIIFYFFRALKRLSDDIVSNSTYRKLFVSDLDIANAEKMFIQFNKKAKPLFGTDTNAPEVFIDKIKISHGEVDDEV